uniref:Putative secreted protein n=1 Tax=Panstrongylus lignarius TaxID=156445 RepID=A0A224XRX4_9HEMI
MPTVQAYVPIHLKWLAVILHIRTVVTGQNVLLLQLYRHVSILLGEVAANGSIDIYHCPAIRDAADLLARWLLGCDRFVLLHESVFDYP